MSSFYLLGAIFFAVIVALLLWISKLKNILTLKEQELKDFKNIFDKAPLFVDTFDKNGKFTLWNKECERVFGWTIEEINAVDNSLALFYPDKDDQKETLEQLECSGHSKFIECYPKTKDGKVIISKWTVIPMSNGTNIAIGYDTTEENRDKIEERTLQLNETKKKLAELNISLEDRVKSEVQKNQEHQKFMILQSRHAQMGEIIGMIAHQWRQPLNILSLVIQDAFFQYKLGKFGDKNMQKLNQESSNQIQQMSDTITNFRNFFKPEKIPVEFNVSSVIDHAISIIHPILKVEKISLEIVLKKDIRIMGYPSELGQSIVNIIVNAKDALIEKSIKDKLIQIELMSTTDKVTITIKDNAGGIPTDIMAKIFDPYFSTKDKQGTGLGLYITKIIIEDHTNGKLSVSNDKDGAVFTIVVPILT